MKVMITGCAGFIGSHATDEFLSAGYDIIGVDALTYAGSTKNMSSFKDKIKFIHGDICDESLMLRLVKDEDIEWIINFAAETHVDNSIDGCKNFIQSNIEGVRSLLDVCKATGCKLFQISTDEVYGSTMDESFEENDKLHPRNPYSATKAAAEHLITSYANTYKTDYKMVRMSNNFGPRQHSEKLIPTILKSLGLGKKIPIYGDGSNIRDWFYVKDCVKMVRGILEKGEKNSIYNLTHNNEMTNIELIKKILFMVGLDYEASVEFIKDRLGHDKRYSIDASKAKHLLGLKPTNFDLSLEETVEFYYEKTQYEKTQ